MNLNEIDRGASLSQFVAFVLPQVMSIVGILNDDSDPAVNVMKVRFFMLDLLLSVIAAHSCLFCSLFN